MSSSLIGQSFGRYLILEQLGEGGMAIVYKARDTRLEREVAIKVIRVDQFPPATLERVLKRFEREARSLAKLSHPGIVTIIDFGKHENIPYLVMEYLPGGTLKRLLGTPMNWLDAIRLIKPIAEALAYAHQHHVVHRDVKPSNILIGESGEPKLSDFGIAKILETGEEQTLTGTGVGVGTPGYMAPEQWTGQSTAQSDIYSLGISLYELLAGRKPYMADTPAAILLQQATEPLPRPTMFASGIPEQVEWVLFKALARSPEDRYQTMGDFAADLGKLSSGVVQKNILSSDKAPSVGPPFGSRSSKGAQNPPIDSSQKNRKIRYWMPWTLVVVALLVILPAMYGLLRPASPEDAVQLSALPETSLQATSIRTPTKQATFTVLPTLPQTSTSTPTLVPDTPTTEIPQGMTGTWTGDCEGTVTFSIAQLNDAYVVHSCAIDMGIGSTFPISYQSWNNEKLTWTCPQLVPYNGPPWYTNTNREHYYFFKVQSQSNDDMQLSLTVTVAYPSNATLYSGVCQVTRVNP